MAVGASNLTFFDLGLHQLPRDPVVHERADIGSLVAQMIEVENVRI
jgi:hypothetical protein